MPLLAEFLSSPERQIFMGSIIAVIGTAIAAVGAYRSSNQRASWEHTLRLKSEELLAKSEQLAQSQIGFENQLRQRSDEIADLSLQLAAKSGELADLARQTTSSVTGGDSFCSVEMFELQSGRPYFIIVNNGAYPIYDLNVRIVDITRFNANRESGSDFWESLKGTEWEVAVGNLPKATALPLADHRLSFTGTDRQSYNIFFIARNGGWAQLLRLRKINGEWVRAYKVERQLQKRSITLVEYIDPKFPRGPNGEPEWD